MAASTEADWVSRFADDVIAEAERRAPGKPVVVASGLSPSGPIHLGNLREVMTPTWWPTRSAAAASRCAT